MINEGLSELMFTSDNVWEMERKKYYLPGGIWDYCIKTNL